MPRSLRRPLVLLFLVLALGAFAPRAARALPRPDLAFTAGTTLAVTGAPDQGGLALAISPLWPVADRLRFGFTLFADDMGTQLSDLRDPNNGVHLGTVPSAHRWAYGGAWRADATVLTHRQWNADAMGEWGYWRLQDDLRGTVTGANSALGFTLGGTVRHALTGPQDVGLAFRYHRVFTHRNGPGNLMGRYVSLALEWRWAGTIRP